MKQSRNVHGTYFAHHVKVIADEIDNYQVFRPVLLATEQIAPKRLVLGWRRTARPGAFDRLGLRYAIRSNLQKSFRRRTKHSDIGEVKQRTVRNRANFSQVGVSS